MTIKQYHIQMVPLSRIYNNMVSNNFPRDLDGLEVISVNHIWTDQDNIRPQDPSPPIIIVSAVVPGLCYNRCHLFVAVWNYIYNYSLLTNVLILVLSFDLLKRGLCSKLQTFRWSLLRSVINMIWCRKAQTTSRIFKYMRDQSLNISLFCI